MIDDEYMLTDRRLEAARTAGLPIPESDGTDGRVAHEPGPKLAGHAVSDMRALRAEVVDDEPRLYVPLGERGGWIRDRTRQTPGPRRPPVLVDGVFGEAVDFKPGRVVLRMTDESAVVVTRPEFDVAHAAALAEMAALDRYFEAASSRYGPNTPPR